MANENINQIFVANPITSNTGTDLMYFGQSPYGAGNDAAMTFANFSAQFGAPYTPAALTKVDDSNVTINLGGSPTNALLHAVSLTLGWTGQLGLIRGGTNASLTASNGGIVYSTATAMAILAGTATANRVLLSGSSTTPAWSTATYPATTTANQLLYSSSNNTVAGLTVLNNAIMTSNGSGAISWGQNIPFQVVVVSGGTGNASFTPFSVICGGTTSTGNLQSVSGLGTSGQVLTSNGAGALPTWQGGGGSTVWSPGSGTNSGVGGDGSAAASGNFSLAYGDTSCNAQGDNSFAFGTGASTGPSSVYSLAFGSNAAANGTGGNLCFGSGATSNGFNSLVFGPACLVQSSSGYNISFGSSCTVAGSSTFSFVMGDTCTVGTGSSNCFVFGNNSSVAAGTANSFAIGNNAVSNNLGSVVWGDGAVTPNQDTGVNQWVQTFTGGYKWYIDTIGPLLPLQIDTSGNVVTSLGQADISYTILTPSTGDTITLNTSNKTTILNPAGTLATLTINMPTSPRKGQLQTVSTSQTITALTVSGNGNSIVGQPTTLVASHDFTMIFDDNAATWYPG